MDAQPFDLKLFKSANLYDEGGKIIPIEKLWRDQPAIMIFLRHFGCIACRAHAVQIWKQRHELIGRGAKLYFIGNGSPKLISKFKKDLGIVNATVLTDPNLRSFQGAGFKRGLLPTFGPKAVVKAIGLFREGHRQGPIMAGNGDRLQLGGVVMMSATGAVKYRFVSEATGDFPEIEQIGTDLQPAPEADFSMR